jgi:glutamyl-tRNA reductase
VSVVVIGLNHRTAPLELLERMAVTESRLPKVLHDVAQREHISEVLVLSTCNRTEVYAAAERFHGAYGDIRNALGELSHLPPEDFADHLYVHYDEAAASHLMGVAAGLDSMVLGESEIQGQVKRAWDRARELGMTGPTLNLLVRHALEAGKRARTDTAIARNIASLSQAAVAMAGERLGGLAGKTVLVLGTGEMGAGMVSALAAAGVAEVRIANRTAAHGQELATRVGGRAVALRDLPAHLAEVDLALTSTGAQSLMVEHGEVEPAVAARVGRPLLIVDIAVPRDVDHTVAELDGVTLLDMDDLQAFVAVGVAERRRQVAGVETILNEELERYVSASSARQVAPLIAALRGRAEEVRASEVERIRSKLDTMDSRQLELIEAATKGVVAKLLHRPTLALKQAAGSTRGDRLAATLRELFEIED